MKQIISIIRDECVEPTQIALKRLGITEVMVFPVMGRGQQKGAIQIHDQEGMLGRNTGPHLRRQQGLITGTGWPGYRQPQKKKAAYGFLQKQMLLIMADEEDVDPVIRELITVNQSGRHGDGKIFVCPIGHVIGLDTEGPIEDTSL
jgi:nitrogen regulatory protein PII 2